MLLLKGAYIHNPERDCSTAVSGGRCTRFAHPCIYDTQRMATDGSSATQNWDFDTMWTWVNNYTYLPRPHIHSEPGGVKTV